MIGALAVRTWPNLTQLLCEASNTNGQLQRQEGELQLARRIFNVIESMGPGVEFKEVKDPQDFKVQAFVRHFGATPFQIPFEIWRRKWLLIVFRKL